MYLSTHNTPQIGFLTNFMKVDQKIRRERDLNPYTIHRGS